MKDFHRAFDASNEILRYPDDENKDNGKTVIKKP